MATLGTGSRVFYANIRWKINLNIWMAIYRPCDDLRTYVCALSGSVELQKIKFHDFAHSDQTNDARQRLRGRQRTKREKENT